MTGGQIELPNGQVINVSAEYQRVRALAVRALSIQSKVLSVGPVGTLSWMRWQMTDEVLGAFAEQPDLTVAGLRALDVDRATGEPRLFGLPVVLVERAEGEHAAWGLYLAIAA